MNCRHNQYCNQKYRCASLFDLFSLHSLPSLIYVYIITKGKKNILNLLGQEDTEHLTYKAVDEIEASGNLFFAVYKVSRSVK